MPDVTVVIANWNGVALLPDCLRSLERCAAHDGVDVETIVVDNGSQDGSVSYLRQSWPDVQVIVNSRNLGFAVANNQGFRAASAPFIATLNNDIRVRPGWFMETLTQMRDPCVGAVATTILYESPPGVVNSTGIEMNRLGRALDRADGTPLGEVTDMTAPFGACAGAALYRAEALSEAGGFDERYFAYYEDVDLAWRLRRMGWACAFSPDATTTHLYSATSSRVPSLKPRLISRNYLVTLWKNAGWLHLIAISPGIVKYILGVTFRVITRKQHPAALRGILEALVRIPVTKRTAGLTVAARDFGREGDGGRPGRRTP